MKYCHVITRLERFRKSPSFLMTDDLINLRIVFYLATIFLEGLIPNIYRDFFNVENERLSINLRRKKLVFYRYQVTFRLP